MITMPNLVIILVTIFPMLYITSLCLIYFLTRIKNIIIFLIVNCSGNASDWVWFSVCCFRLLAAIPTCVY